MLGAVVVVLSLPLIAAFEAHVVNVTARIENALSVPLEHIGFGTVFPQEHLKKGLLVALSQSFIEEDRVDDVDYVIRQKPKCGITSQNGEVLDESATATGHVGLGPDDRIVIDCGEPPRPLSDGEQWGVLPSLCEYISKEPDLDPQPGNDGSLASFHEPFTFIGRRLVWNDTLGHLAKSAQDIVDNWTIDLAVPCFGGHCGQDWADFVHGINATADPNQYIQPLENEHKVFGCDLWIEVGGISLPGIGCNEELDLMLVLDRSLSIDATELATLKTAAHAFVDALAPDGGPHIGQASFAPSATLDLHLTGNETDIDNAIDALSTAGGTATNLEAGILTASGELDDLDPHERPGVPDFMVIITDGAPNTCNSGGCDPEDAAAAAADAAKLAGTEIFVVGVGTSTSTATFLRDEIASGADHYFDASNFDDLQAILEGIAQCEE